MRDFTLHALLMCFTLGAAGCSDGKPGAPTPPAGVDAVAVETRTVGTAPWTQELVAVGSLRSDNAVAMRPEVAGRIVRIAFDEGQAVSRGALLFALDDSVQRAELEHARATLVLAERNFSRAAELHGRNLLSQSDRDQAAANLDLARAAVAVAQAHLDRMRLVAPFAGVAGLRHVSIGDYVTAGQDLVNLEALDTLKVDFRVDESALPALRVGQPITVEVDAYPGETFAGAVYAVEPRVVEATRAIALRARMPNPDGRLRPGQFARVRLQIGHAGDAIVVPEEAIFPRGERQYVYVVENDLARLREIRIGDRRPGQVEVRSGLSVGETLVVTGQQRLNDGTAVRYD